MQFAHCLHIVFYIGEHTEFFVRGESFFQKEGGGTRRIFTQEGGGGKGTSLHDLKSGQKLNTKTVFFN